MPPPLPGLPFQHPQREALRQIGEDYAHSQGPHWEHRDTLGPQQCRVDGIHSSSLQDHSWQGQAREEDWLALLPVWTMPAEGAETHTFPRQPTDQEML